MVTIDGGDAQRVQDTVVYIDRSQAMKSYTLSWRESSSDTSVLYRISSVLHFPTSGDAGLGSWQRVQDANWFVARLNRCSFSSVLTPPSQEKNSVDTVDGATGSLHRAYESLRSATRAITGLGGADVLRQSVAPSELSMPSQ